MPIIALVIDEKSSIGCTVTLPTTKGLWNKILLGLKELKSYFSSVMKLLDFNLIFEAAASVSLNFFSGAVIPLQPFQRHM